MSELAVGWRGHLGDSVARFDSLAEHEATLGDEWGGSVGHEDLGLDCAGLDTCITKLEVFAKGSLLADGLRK